MKKQAARERLKFALEAMLTKGKGGWLMAFGGGSRGLFNEAATPQKKPKT
jgi:hypothetical protein